LIGLFTISVNAQVVKYTCKQLHSHNDYQQTFPFWDAYNHGFGSIEVDVFLWNNSLLVGHEVKELHPKKTIEELYLEPLNKLAKENKLGSLLLLVDLKTEAISTLDALVKILYRYPALLQEKKLQITIEDL
jgi:alkaline phosphatase